MKLGGKAMERFCDLKQKEVINVCDGCRLGYVTDLEFDIRTGKIVALIIPAENGKMWNLFGGGSREYYIAWKCIKKIGDDIILVEANLEELLQECP